MGRTANRHAILLIKGLGDGDVSIPGTEFNCIALQETKQKLESKQS